MPQLSIAPGSTGVTVQVRILDKTKADGSGLSGLAYDTASLTAYYNRERGASTQITLATLAAADSAWSSGGFKEIDATNKPGEYRLDLPDAVCATGARFAAVTLRGASHMADCVLMIDLKNDGCVADYVSGTSPAELVLETSANKIYTDANGRVRSTYPMRKNASGSYIPFEMFTLAGARSPSETVTVTISKDGTANFSTAGTGTVVEAGGGAYWYLPSAADLNSSCTIFKFDADGCESSFGYATPQA